MDMWRFESMVLPYLDPNIKYFWFTPIIVESISGVVGSCRLFVLGEQLWGEFVLDKSIPERLEVEIGESVWTQPVVEVFPATLNSHNAHTEIHFKKVCLSKSNSCPEHFKIGRIQ